MELKLELTAQDLAAIGHVVADPRAWAAHAFETLGAAAVRAKVDKYRVDYEQALAAEGAAYKTAAERMADSEAAAAVLAAERATALAAQRALDADKERAEFEAAVAKAVAKALAK